MFCLSCQYEAHKVATGEWPSTAAAAHWAMWGCTCDPAVEKRAQEYMEMFTR